MRVSLTLHDLDATTRFADALAAVLLPGDVLLLEGEMGAGKTTLVRSVSSALGADMRSVSSPTFAVVQQYETDRAPVTHIDAYRLSGEDDEELEKLGWDRAVGGASITLIEWGERVASWFAAADIARLTLAHAGETVRTAEIEIPDAWTGRAGMGDLLALCGRREDTTCPVTGRPVTSDSPTWPFADERARMADLHRWFSGSYTVSRPAEQADLEQGE